MVGAQEFRDFCGDPRLFMDLPNESGLGMFVPFQVAPGDVPTPDARGFGPADHEDGVVAAHEPFDRGFGIDVMDMLAVGADQTLTMLPFGDVTGEGGSAEGTVSVGHPNFLFLGDLLCTAETGSLLRMQKWLTGPQPSRPLNYNLPMLQIREIYPTLQGEGPSTGVPATFVRLTGCSLRCRWCDSEYAFSGGEPMSTDAILERVRDQGRELVVVTGGEPLDQPMVHGLMAALVERGHRVELETGGHRPLDSVPRGVRIHMDLKTPSSGMARRNRWANLSRLTRDDILKIVIASRDDYIWFRDTIRERWEECLAPVWLSPAFGVAPTPGELIEHVGLDPAALAGWILDDRLPVRLGLQMHKLLWRDPAPAIDPQNS